MLDGRFLSVWYNFYCKANNDIKLFQGFSKKKIISKKNVFDRASNYVGKHHCVLKEKKHHYFIN